MPIRPSGCLATVTLIVMLAGCQDAELGTLQGQLDTLRHKPQGQIAALPDMPDYAMGVYHERDRRSPFVADIGAAPEPVEQTPLPNASRLRQPLEAFALDSLDLVGMLSVAGNPSILVQAPDGRVHRLQMGDYLGRDYGQISAIDARGLTLIETVRDEQGGWRERPQRLEMAAQSTGG